VHGRTARAWKVGRRWGREGDGFVVVVVVDIVAIVKSCLGCVDRELECCFLQLNAGGF
jgi:hypothetical protein